MPSLKSGKNSSAPPDLGSIRERLSSVKGQAYWRGLEDLADNDTFKQFVHREYPRQASAWHPAMSRRAFLTMLGASLSLAGLNGCAINQSSETIVPYIDQPDGMTPGKPLTFATAMTVGGYATGLLVTSREGRPIKIEGNPNHPASLGATDAIHQASLLTLYDPDRSQAVVHNGIPDSWDAFLGMVNARMQELKAVQGRGLRILTETITSPTLTAQIRALLAKYPEVKWHSYESVGRGNVKAGALLAFGTPVNTLYRFDRARVIVSFDGDFLMDMHGHVRYAHDFGAKRRVRSGSTNINRLYAAETSPSITGAMADNRLPLRPSEIDAAAFALARRLGIANIASAPLVSSEIESWLNAAVADLKSNEGACVVVAGDHQSASVHALVHAMNSVLGNVGETLLYTEPIESTPPDPAYSLGALVRDMQAGLVSTIFVFGGNPVYDAPADLNFTAAFEKVPLRIHHSLYEDETSALCHWHLPEAHYLESWSDARAFDGTVTILQPLIAPLYGGRTAHGVLDAVLGSYGRTDHDILKSAWQADYPPDEFDAFWRKTLHDGIVAGSAAPAKTVAVRSLASLIPTTPIEIGSSLEIVFRPDPTVWDGRFANNGWLQELPKPLSKLTWDNAALLSPRTAEAYGLTNTMLAGDVVDVVELHYQGRSVKAPALIVPGHPDSCVTVTLGYGRTRAGNVGTGVGFSAESLRSSDAPWYGSGLVLHKTNEQMTLAITHTHHTMEGRDIVRIGSIETFRRDPGFAHSKEHAPEKPEMMLEESPRPGRAWGMAIDVNTCIGCNACVTACQAENNIPIVGKTEVTRGREMHWIRIDRYYTGANLDRPDTVNFMPVTCMQCEKAPCELVCPVEATVHDAEGINQMVYNRCVGTRYCSNNCPYKVRRFNFLQYADLRPTIQLMRNPDVTVRSRGVMEKCTYCTQRIENAKIDAEVAGRTLNDGDIRTACQQACPTQAIVFGDINDPNSQVSRAKAEPHNYSLLSELNTRPRTSYLAKLTNANLNVKAEQRDGNGSQSDR
jgi:molybdopterin-containing oxidoreductase family iron-sulfur binding subunit